VKTEKVKL